MGIYTGRGWGERQGVVRPTRLIRFGTYTIRNGRNGGLESYLRAMSQSNTDLGIFQETELTKRIYTSESSGYKVVATEALSAQSGGVAVLYRAAEKFYVEALHTYGANVVSFQMASGDRQWYIVGRYLDPEDASITEYVVLAIGKRPLGAALLVVGDFNTNLSKPEGRDKYEGIAAALTKEGLEDMSSHFLPRNSMWLKDGRT